VFVANHSSHLDAPLILCSLPPVWRRQTLVAAAADYFFDDWWRAFGTALVFGTVPLDRTGGSTAAAPAATPQELLADGWSLLLFPEGTRAVDGQQGSFKTGAARLSLASGAPIVPIGIRGSYAAMPRGRGWPVPGRPPVTVRFGEPIRQGPDENVRELGARVERAVAQLVDEDATTWWDATRRAASGQTPSTAGPDVAQWRRVWASTQSPSGERRPKIWHR
jgi:1-acyl-sn-glycerol-3-phosphate acyltransferase